MEAITPVVQVVTGGTDWPAIVAAISTGVVGLAGIFGTLWQGKRAREAASSDLKVSLGATTANLNRSINAENERAQQAAKRHAYAAFHVAINDFVVAVSSGEDLNSEAARSAFAKARTALLSTNAEVALIAPKQIDDLMDELVAVLTDLMEARRANPSAPRPPKLDEEHRKLFDAMRADLGETD